MCRGIFSSVVRLCHANICMGSVMELAPVSWFAPVRGLIASPSPACPGADASLWGAKAYHAKACSERSGSEGRPYS